MPELRGQSGPTARNNIQESLRDLGADTPYTQRQAVDPAIEQSTQPDCTPITGWRFTLGTGIAPGKVVGPWGSLSVVSSPFSTDVTTQASVPDRDGQGRPLAGTSIAGATTIELTEEQAKLAEASSRLWIQGGTPTDPVLANVPAFAASSASGPCAAPSTTSTATTSSGSSSRPGAGTSTASRTT